MTKEKSRIIRNAEKVVGEYAVRKTREGVKCAYVQVNHPKGQSPLHIRKLTRNANEWIDFLAGKDKAAYDRFRLRLFKSDSGEFSLGQGREVKTVNPRQKRG